ncbi:uncharacterized protein LOC116424947 isoform X2 [Nomia melanderi]|uniref:uncharacterized protein LOC116424947 isoform X2 n=1 Tax=Nomia melanderi TaxID=2448451 RepID=UPI003FCC2BA6
MLNQTSEELIVSAPPGAEKTPKQSLKPRKLTTRTFDFLWRRNSRREDIQKKEDVLEVKIVECNVNNTVPRKTSFSFFKNIKNHIQIRKLSVCKAKEKENEIQLSSTENKTNCDLLTLQNDISRVSTEENNVSEIRSDGVIGFPDEQNSSEIPVTNDSPFQNEEVLEGLDETLENYSDITRKLDLINSGTVDEIQTDNSCENVPSPYQSCSDNQEQLRYSLAIGNKITDYHFEDILESMNSNEILNNDNKVKASLTEELLKLSNYGWYWGPISGHEADAKLISEPDGAFLVRDSSDDRYVLTLSFKSSGKLLHARMEHSGGLFSLCNQSESEGFSSVADLIDYSMNFSQTAVICYSRPKYPGHPSFPVRLTKPGSFILRSNER